MAKKASSQSNKRKASGKAGSSDEFVWRRKDLLGLDELSKEEIVHILDTAELQGSLHAIDQEGARTARQGGGAGVFRGFHADADEFRAGGKPVVG